ncbi:transcriptional regulator [Catellatospora methionotrophica]|uniref:Transcriptional regulator n=1 Tax=Catellatospora methionotrophica TaxID=121620 RepID=A0A8J3LKW2_9ACTN|nr:helix-turn-helix domain-containing protein [Catellatospora methionotrophica]GIG14610.1 transcriptional regulator [Catellatospora methionotrophica]
MTDRPTVDLTDPVALRAYAHPLRMSLVGLLRREGPLTATQAADRLGESVPNCSFHLRQLAKYGLVERAEGADAREKPWRATALSTRWGRESDDAETRAAVDQLDGVLIHRLYERALRWLARRDADPPQWRAVTGPGDDLAYLTAEELGELSRRIDDLFDAYRDRRTDPSQRPPGARPVHLGYYVTTIDQP